MIKVTHANLSAYIFTKGKIACFSGHIEDHDVHLTRKEFDNANIRTSIPGVRRAFANMTL